jgi:hypothetical protein|tara:strand:- start:4242 stop:4463 length:222 start_codon:yes stop_codon:yes gene_type:complete
MTTFEIYTECIECRGIGRAEYQTAADDFQDEVCDNCQGVGLVNFVEDFETSDDAKTAYAIEYIRAIDYGGQDG